MNLDVIPVLVALGVALAIGAAMLCLLSVIAATRDIARTLWGTFWTEVVILSVATVPFLFGGPVLLLFLALLAVRVGYECGVVALTRAHPGKPLQSGDRTLAYVIAACTLALAIVAIRTPFELAIPAGMIMAALLAIGLFLRRKKTPSRCNALVEIALFPGVPLLLFVSAAADPAYSVVLLIAFLLVETYDSYALLGGKLAGRRQAFPRLSPRKTVEGLAIGAFSLALTAIVAGRLMFATPALSALAVAVVVAVFSVVGDLAASRLKRAAGVKDYPAVLPRQGGAFDIADAWIMTGPALAILAVAAEKLVNL